ncbi:hypothetical protein [Brevundimonas sp. NIBR11]|uniref:hypothetical protein n=1 Tax=Brevundimonas sp. NIBR11 TaxID=3015999 RepID=UPI0022EFFF1D|nr:hypothetical protein [Brevundimonas sp. NIBR11]WGM32710.1 hypothetical protein KKHFBJBL_02964 [Brevundimonas sp. NIBR11]
MSCGIVLAAALLLSDPNVALAAAEPAAVAGAPISIAAEPLFADIVSRAGALKTVVDSWNGALPPDFAAFRTRAEELAALDMQGHLILKERGTDGDLKCILRGISEDISTKLTAVEAADNDASRATALSELSYLLNDNVEVITTPPHPDAQSGVAAD